MIVHIVSPTGFEFALNFSDELTEIILETKYMEQLGFPVPELARSVALQEEKFTGYQDGIKKCLQRYQACIASLAPAEVCTCLNITSTYLSSNIFRESFYSVVE